MKNYLHTRSHGPANSAGWFAAFRLAVIWCLKRISVDYLGCFLDHPYKRLLLASDAVRWWRFGARLVLIRSPAPCKLVQGCPQKMGRVGGEWLQDLDKTIQTSYICKPIKSEILPSDRQFFSLSPSHQL